MKQCLSSRPNLKKNRKNFKFFILKNEPDASQLPLDANFAFATHSIQNESCAQLLDNDHPHIHVLIEVTKHCVDVVIKMTSTTFVVPCLLSSFKHLKLGCSKLHLSGTFMENLKIAVNFNNSINNSTDIDSAPLRRRLPQVCFASQTRSIQTQTDIITNVTIECFFNFSNGDNAAKFSKIIDIIPNGYGRLEIDSQTFLLNLLWKRNLNFNKLFSFCFFIQTLKKLTTPAGGVLEERSDPCLNIFFGLDIKSFQETFDFRLFFLLTSLLP